MKKSISRFLLLVFLSTFFTNIAFAGDAIPGVGVGAGKNPQGIIKLNTKTGKDGKFAFKLESGVWDIKLSYDEMLKIIDGLNKNKKKDKYEITLVLNEWDSCGILVNGKESGPKILITRETKSITVSAPKKGATISGTLTFE